MNEHGKLSPDAKIESPRISLRLATMDDAKILLEWRNDEFTRQSSIQTTPVLWEEHMKWLKPIVSGESHGRTIYIAEAEGVPVGMVRLDREVDAETGKNFVEISYSVAPDARGKGYGKAMVLHCKDTYMRGEDIKATIKKGHAPSEHIAIELGLHPVAEKLSENPEDPRPVVEWRS